MTFTPLPMNSDGQATPGMELADHRHIEYYECVARSTQQMLSAARRQDWDGLIKAELACSASIDMIRALRALPLSRPEQLRKAEIIRRVLDDDAAIRAITEPKLAELESLLRGSANERKVGLAYGQHQAATSLLAAGQD